jgi:hypothetical protein
VRRLQDADAAERAREIREANIDPNDLRYDPTKVRSCTALI